jgi:uncharacterized protein (DUF433 family)
MKLPRRIEAKADVMMGKPCIKGTRIPVYLILQKMAAGEGTDELLGAYPQLASQDLAACLEIALLSAPWRSGFGLGLRSLWSRLG